MASYVHCFTCGEKDHHYMIESHLCSHRGGYNGPNESVTVYYENAAGKIMTPWTKDGKPPEGFRRVEVRGGAALRQFERKMNQIEKDRHENHIERRERVYEPQIRAARADLLRSITTQRGRDFALAAIERNNRRNRSSNYDPGFRRES